MLTIDTFTGDLSEQVARQILLSLAADDAPIYASIVGTPGGVVPTVAEEFHWYRDSLPSRRTQINDPGDTLDAASVALVVDDASVFFPDCLVLAEATGEIMLCTAVDTGTNTITVRRGVGSKIAAADASVDDNAYLNNIGSAAEEGADQAEGRHVAARKFTNVVQTFRHPVEFTGRLARVRKDTENEIARQRRDTFQVHLRDIEGAMLFGAYDTDEVGSSGKRTTTTEGLFQAITTNVDNVGGALSLSRLDQFAEMAFHYGEREKVLFAGSTLHRAIHDLYRAKLEVRSMEGEVGLRVAVVKTAFGELQLVHHRGLVGGYAQQGIVVDPADVNFRVTEGGDAGADMRGLAENGRTMFKPETQSPGKDSAAGEWFTEGGLQYGDELRHAVIKGVTGAA